MASSSRPTRRSPGEVPEHDRTDALFPPRTDRLPIALEALQGAGPDYAAVLESICGATDDSQPVEQYDGTLGVPTAFVAARQKPAVQVAWNADLGTRYTNPGDVSGVRWGSATLISPDLVLTCGHLFDQDPNGWTVPRQNGTSSAIPPAEIATNMHINLLYQVDPGGTLRTEVSVPIVALVEYRLGGLDMAIVRVAGTPGTTYGWTAVSATNPAVGDMLAIIGHPAGLPKRVEAGPATQVTTSVLRYSDIDTLGGNSGSGILLGATGELVGVHTNGGCTSSGGSNSGVAIAAIRAASPTLQALPHGSHTATADDVFTILAADTSAASDVVATLTAADSPVTLRAADSHTISDQIGTLLTLDTQRAADTHNVLDQIGTLRLADTLRAADLGTIAALDQGTRFAGDLGTGFAGDDPHTLVEGVGTLVEGAGDPGFPVVDPPWAGGLGGVLGGLLGGVNPAVRPFVQAGPYTPVAAEQEQHPLAALLAELEQAIAATQATLASLEAVYGALASGLTGDDQ